MQDKIFLILFDSSLFARIIADECHPYVPRRLFYFSVIEDKCHVGSLIV